MKKLFVIPLVAATLFASSCSMLKTTTTKKECELPGASEPKTAEDFITRARKFYEQNNMSPDKAGCGLAACEEAIKLDPNNPDAFYCRAMALRIDDREKAIADASKAIELDPKNPIFYSFRGSLQGELRRYQEALADSNKELELLGPGGATASSYTTRGKWNLELGKFEDALRDYDEAIKLRPADAELYMGRAVVHERMGNGELAAADKGRAASLNALKGKVPGPTDQEGPAEKPNANTGDSGKISGGMMNSKAISMPEPEYPAAAKAARASGAVIVNITVNAKGEVVAAQAMSGHPLLKAPAVKAAMQAKFNPGPASIQGSLTYDFKE